MNRCSDSVWNGPRTASLSSGTIANATITACASELNRCDSYCWQV